jgi:predicted transcriptional regulator
MTRSELEAIQFDNETQLAERVPAEWRGEFLKFIREGDASSSFLDFLDGDAATQAAVEVAFAEQVRNFERFAEELDIPADVINDHLKTRKIESGDAVRETYSSLRNGVLRWLSLQPKEKNDLARKFEDSGDLAPVIEGLIGLEKSLIKRRSEAK